MILQREAKWTLVEAAVMVGGIRSGEGSSGYYDSTVARARARALAEERRGWSGTVKLGWFRFRDVPPRREEENSFAVGVGG